MYIHRQLCSIDSRLAEQSLYIAQQLTLAAGEGVRSRNVSMMWGGGKDSSVALVIVAAAAEIAGWDIVPTVMIHPGMTKGVLANIDRMSESLHLVPQFWCFGVISDPEDPTVKTQWNLLYRRLIAALAGAPRFMCVACNFGAFAAELGALLSTQAPIRVTGNLSWELRRFDEWKEEMYRSFGKLLRLPELATNGDTDYFVIWHTIYSAMLAEILSPSEIATYNWKLADSALELRSIPSYQMPVLQRSSGVEITPAAHLNSIAAFGWKLPQDIMGSTESDCGFPAAIAHLNIRKHGFAKHQVDFGAAVRRFGPLPLMEERAKRQLSSGEAVRMGLYQLTEMGIADDEIERLTHVAANVAEKYPICRALSQQLFSIR